MSARQALEGLKHSEDKMREQECLDVLAYSSWKGISRLEIREALGERVITEGSLLWERLWETEVNVKFIPPLPPLGRSKRLPPSADVETSKPTDLGNFAEALKTWHGTLKDSVQLSKTYSNLTGSQRYTAEAKMRQVCRNLYRFGQWRLWIKFCRLFMALATRGFKTLAWEIAAIAGEGDLFSYRTPQTLPSVRKFLEEFLKLMVDGVIVQQVELRVSFIQYCIKKLEAWDVKAGSLPSIWSCSCWNLLIELSTSLPAEPRGRLLETLSKNCCSWNPVTVAHGRPLEKERKVCIEGCPRSGQRIVLG